MDVSGRSLLSNYFDSVACQSGMLPPALMAEYRKSGER